MQMIRSFRIFLILSFVFIITGIFAQKLSLIDSLNHIVNSNVNDTVKVNALNDLSMKYAGSGDGKSAIKSANEALQLALSLNFKGGAAAAYKNIGNAQIGQGNYSDALAALNSALKISRDIGDKKGIAYAYSNIGSIYYYQGNFAEALKGYFASLEIKEQLGDKKGIASAYNNIANIYFEQGNFPEALEKYLLSLKIRKEIGDKKGIAVSYNNIGSIYDNQRNYPEAIKNHLASLEIKKELGDKKGIAYSYNNIGIVYFHEGNYQEAVKNYITSFNIYEEIGDKRGIANVCIDLGKVCSKQGLKADHENAGLKFSEARQYLGKSLVIATEIGDKDGLKNCYACLSEIDSAQGNYAQALTYYKLFSLYKDSLLNEEGSKQVAQMKIRFETEKKDREIELLGKENSIKSLQVERQEASLLASQLQLEKNQNEILFLNKSKELQQLQLARTTQDLEHQQLKVKAQSAGMDLMKKEKQLKEEQLNLLQFRNRQQMILLIVFIAGTILLIVVVIFIINSRRRLNKAYLTVNQQKEEISRVLGELESTNMDRDSANQELEAFTWSVSHDLRSPVRRIESLSRLLKEDYDSLLDKEGKDLLTRITESSVLSLQLIEELLKLSKITHQPVSRIKCNLSKMSQKICEGLKQAYPGHSVTCNIEENIMVDADFQLLQIALQNILDNAWKYTRDSVNPEISVSSKVSDNKKLILVRDNGLGFDMVYAVKLFTPFQHFHSDEHFNGTGIGLATVKRIIMRHGGKITAQSEPGKGTTFSFTLE